MTNRKVRSENEEGRSEKTEVARESTRIGANGEEEVTRETHERARKVRRQKAKKRTAKTQLPITNNQSLITRFVSTLMIMSLLVTSNPAAPGIVYASAGEFGQDVRYSFLSNFGSIQNLNSYNPVFGLYYRLKGKDSGKKRRQQRIASIKIQPEGDLVLHQGQRMDFSAIGYSSNGEPVNGIKFEWTAKKLNRKKAEQLRIPNGRFKARSSGEFAITASAQGQKAQVTVKVERNEAYLELKRLKKEKKKGNLAEAEKIKLENKFKSVDISSRKKYKKKKQKKKNEQSSSISNIISWLSESEEKPSGPNAIESESKAASVKMRRRPADEDGWDENNWWIADDPDQQVGNPPGTSPDAGAGNGNFQFSAPVVALPGRGIDINLSLYYNSKLWNKDGTEMIYDADKGYPAPGWTLGFGKLVYVGTSGGCMMADANGTRHGYTGTVTSSTGSSTWVDFDGNTSDGTFIDYECQHYSSSTGSSLYGSAKLPNGTVIDYGSYYQSGAFSGQQAYPTRITDANGNYISISYRSARAPEISTITDTMGRVITFNYDSTNRLVSVTVPKFGSGTRTAVRLHYKTMTLSTGFSGLTTNTATNTPTVIDSIYYPGTNTGYWFNDSDSYSSYGMIKKVKKMRGMTSTGTNTNQGNVTAGLMSKQAVYNYPATANYSLTDAPTYTTLTETWAGMDTAAAVTTYSTNLNANPRTVTVMQPNGLKSKQYMYYAPGQWNDGLIYKDETLNASNAVIGKSEVTWQQGDYNSPRPTIMEATDEKGQKLKTVKTYGSKYNQIISEKKYDYNGTTVLRETVNTYENSTSYTDNHIFNLVKSTEIKKGSTRYSKKVYEYDNNVVLNGTSNHNLAPATGVIKHQEETDPYTTQTTSGNICLQWAPIPGCPPRQRTCNECVQWNQISVYDPNTVFRGNVTKITTYENAQSLTGAISETRKYDITGNLVESSSSCCEIKKYTYNVSNQYAYPISQTNGSPTNSAQQNTMSVVYDFNTGLVKQKTDSNGRVSFESYNVNTLRPTISTSSTGSYTQTTHDPLAMTITTEKRESNGVLASKHIQHLNGKGQAIKEETLGANNIWDKVEIKYKNMGQIWKQTRPYRTGQTPQWTEIFYDIQRRKIKIQDPDGSYAQLFYNETTKPSSASSTSGQTTRIVDQWGRERWGRYDAQKKLAEVVEPNPNGNGSVFSSGNLSSKYTYDPLGRLTQTNQGSQLRKFKYDSLGRLTHQKLAEQSATINNAGTYVGLGGAGAIWSGAFFYDDRSNLVQKTDARGVKINYSYQISGSDDPLNRVQSITYDLSGPRDTSITVHSAPNVSYEYMTMGDKTRVKKVTTSGFSSEDYTYDVESRVSNHKLTFTSKPNYPMETSYIYDTLSRVKEVRYPKQYGMSGNPRKIVKYTYDIASRLNNITIGGQQQAGNIAYNPSDQITSMKVGPTGANQISETYAYNDKTGLITNQKVEKGGLKLLDLSYDYQRLNSKGTLNGKTGHLTKITNNLDSKRNREYEYDAVGRLTKMKGGANLSTQTYTYDRYGNRTNVAATGNAADSSAMPRDGLGSLAFNAINNRITTAGFQYDVAGNQTRAKDKDGTSWIKFEYDAANRLKYVKRDNGTNLQSFEYGSNNERLTSQDYLSNKKTVYSGNQAEYIEFTANVPTWTKSYIYLEDNLLSTISKSGSTETTEYNHPDRLGTKIVTNPTTGTSGEQTALPFGTTVNAESTTSQSKLFTSYDRSSATGLDYAINRTYDSKQGRFTQVDPIGIKASMLESPQTLNLYTYCANDPINHTDPDGLFFGKLFKWIGKILKAIGKAILAAVTTVVSGVLKILRLIGQIPVIGPIIETIGTIAYLAFLFASGVGAGFAAALAAKSVLGAIAAFAKALAPFAKALGLLYIQAFIDGAVGVVIESVKSEIREHGFWKGLFRGLGKGFKYLGQALFGRGLSGVAAIYGFFCSPKYGTDGPQANETPIDDLDAACKAHDLAMERINREITDPKERARAKLKEDLIFMRRVLFSRSRNPRASPFRSIALIAFTFRIIKFRLQS